MSEATILKVLESDIEPLLVDVAGAARLLGIGQRTVWELTKAKQLTVVRIGRRTLWPTADLRAWIDEVKDKATGNVNGGNDLS